MRKSRWAAKKKEKKKGFLRPLRIAVKNRLIQGNLKPKRFPDLQYVQEKLTKHVSTQERTQNISFSSYSLGKRSNFWFKMSLNQKAYLCSLCHYQYTTTIQHANCKQHSIFFKLHARVGKSACKILKGIFAQFTRQKIGANGRMTVVPAFLRFLDGSFIKKISGEIHKTQL